MTTPSSGTDEYATNIVGSEWDRSRSHRHWKKIREAAGQPDLHFHDLRHWHLSIFAAESGDPKALQARAGHESALRVYGHELPGAQDEAVDRVAEKIFARRKRFEG